MVPRVFVYMLKACKFCIWGARNDFHFRGVRPSAVDVMERVKSRVRFNLSLFFRRFRCDRRRRRYFVRQWGARVVVASLHKAMHWLFIFRFSLGVSFACPGRFSGVNQRLGVG